MGYDSRMRIQALRREALPDALVDRVRGQILSGELQPGAPLPSERELAMAYGINRTTVREAMRELERVGLISRRQGQRCRVLDYRENGSIDLVQPLMRLRGAEATRVGTARSLADAIRVAYRAVVDLAIERASDAQIEALDPWVDRVAEAIAARDAEAMMQAEQAFHRELFRCMDSIVFELLLNSVYGAMDGSEGLVDTYARSSAAGYIATQRPREELEHHRLVVALRARDRDTALELVERLCDHIHDLVTRSVRRGRPDSAGGPR